MQYKRKAVIETFCKSKSSYNRNYESLNEDLKQDNLVRFISLWRGKLSEEAI